MKCTRYFLYGLNMTCPFLRFVRFVFLWFGPWVSVLFGEAVEMLGVGTAGSMSQDWNLSTLGALSSCFCLLFERMPWSHSDTQSHATVFCPSPGNQASVAEPPESASQLNHASSQVFQVFYSQQHKNTCLRNQGKGLKIKFTCKVGSHNQSKGN